MNPRIFLGSWVNIIPVLLFACLAATVLALSPGTARADAGGPILYLMFMNLAAFAFGELLATGIEFVWLVRVYDAVSRWRLLWWAVLINAASTYAGAALALLLMPVYFKYFGVGEWNPVWGAIWFVLTLLPAYLLTVFIEFRLLRWLQRGREEFAHNRLMRVVLAMNGVSFIGLVVIWVLFALFEG